ncbi:MAG: hypothetical protein DHS20C15_19840 [Planctomycetota bacterium]|nr:MAG: hypothetical protein DHS20C15_19840 [Planctomycetota bacterium]
MDAAQRGTSLLEVMLVVIVLGIVIGAGAPRASLAAEEARVDGAAATLRSLWHAQRLFRLEAGVYSRETSELEEQRLIDTAVFAAQQPFVYRLVDPDDDSFEFEAERVGSSVWSGVLSIDSDGVISGRVLRGGGDEITPMHD